MKDKLYVVGVVLGFLGLLFLLLGLKPFGHRLEFYFALVIVWTVSYLLVRENHE